MAYKVIDAVYLLVGLMLLVGSCSAAVLPAAAHHQYDQHHYDQHHYDLPVLSTFREVNYDVVRGLDGTYGFSFSLPQQTRTEQRHADGKVTGSFAFVDRFGQEVSVRYIADEDGYRPESDALPQALHHTKDVALAREQFLRNYQLRAKFLEELASNEDESSEESSEESYKFLEELTSNEDESSEESSEESYEDYYDVSSEENEESNEDD